MFLDTLRLNNFRSFEDKQICFGKWDCPPLPALRTGTLPIISGLAPILRLACLLG
jgi:hypothetical protein